MNDQHGNERYVLIKYMLKELEVPCRQLTRWEEEEFLPSAREHFEVNGTLSRRQYEILARLYSEKTA